MAKPPPALNARSTGVLIKWMSRAQTLIYKSSKGRLGGKFLKGAPVALLTTTGRKTGEDHRSWTDREIPIVICDP